jgi:hypothetical protein
LSGAILPDMSGDDELVAMDLSLLGTPIVPLFGGAIGCGSFDVRRR